MFFDENAPFYAENIRFQNLIRYYANRLRDPHSEGELWGFLWLLQRSVPRPLSDRYTAVCIRNEYIRLSKQEGRNRQLSGSESTPQIDLDMWIDLRRILSALSSAERSAVLLRYGFGFEQNESAKLLKISRQALHKNQVRAFRKIRAEISMLDKTKRLC